MRIVLTTSERLFLLRRRAGRTIAQEAKHRGMSREIYGQWERGREIEAPVPAVYDLEDYEIVRILRRRAGLTQGKLAAKLGLSEFWVREAEMNAPGTDQVMKRILDYWTVHSKETR